MSAIYDNWERLVAAVLKKQQLWQLFHQQSRSPSIVSEASDFSDSDSEFSTSSNSQESPRGSNLVIVSEFSPKFDVKDESRISCMLISRGTFGSTYKATIDGRVRIVVKKIESVGVSEVDFERCMRIVGDIRHQNVVALRAYCSSHAQRFLFYDYQPHGSMYSLLHGRQRDGNLLNVEWETRLKIAIGAAKGIAAIHSGMLVHGNIKASNIFLDHKFYGCVSDLGLASLIQTNFDSTARCHAPEVKNTQHISEASDVYSFGVLLLELLTRKSSADVPGGSASVDLVQLVKSVISKEKAATVFDADLLEHPSINNQMVGVLQIGMQCVAKSTKKRPTIFQVLKMLIDIDDRPINPEWYFRKRLVFVDGSNLVYDFKNLLRASAERLRPQARDNCYLVEIFQGVEKVVVKSYRDATITETDFKKHMKVLGRLRHENVVTLRAYVFSRGDILLVYDYYNLGSVSGMLHGTTGMHLDWATRLKIAVEAARGVAYIHTNDIMHGNIKSSNILLNGQSRCAVSEAGLTKLINSGSLAKLLFQVYQAPEIRATREVSQASDVYSFGVVLFELVLGREAEQRTDEGGVMSLIKWVQLAISDGFRITQIFDSKCFRHETEGEMKQVFEIARDCVSIVPEHRPKMAQVAQMLEEINGINTQEAFVSGSSSIHSKLEYILENVLPTLAL